MLKNLSKISKTKLFLIVFLFITIILDFFFAGIIRTMLQNDATKLISNGEPKLIMGGPGGALVTGFEATKSGSLIFASTSVLLIGISQFCALNGLLYFSYKDKTLSSTMKVVIIVALAAALYNIIGGSIKLSSINHTASFDVTANGTITDPTAIGLNTKALVQAELSQWLNNANWENWMETIFATVSLASVTGAGYLLANNK